MQNNLLEYIKILDQVGMMHADIALHAYEFALQQERDSYPSTMEHLPNEARMKAAKRLSEAFYTLGKMEARNNGS